MARTSVKPNVIVNHLPGTAVPARLTLTQLGAALIVGMMVFNGLVHYWGMGNAIYALTGVVSIGALLRTIVHRRMDQSVAWVVPFGAIGFIAFCWSGLTISIAVAGVGFIGLFAYLLLWLFLLAATGPGDRERFFALLIRLHVVLGTCTAAVAIYQSFFDPDLFGTLPIRPWTDLDLIDLGYTQRATAFIGSPQNLGLYLGIVVACVLMSSKSLAIKVILLVPVLIAGILSGSAAFVVFLVMLTGGSQHIRGRMGRTALRTIALLVPAIAALAWAQQIEGLENMAAGALYLGNPFEDRLALLLGLSASENPYVLFFGHGLGTANRVTEVLLGEGFTPTQWQPSESYLGTVGFEMGLMGLVAFLAVMVVALKRAASNGDKRGRIALGLNLGLFANFLVTPSFTGLTMAAIVWPFLLASLFMRVSQSDNRAQLAA